MNKCKLLGFLLDLGKKSGVLGILIEGGRVAIYLNTGSFKQFRTKVLEFRVMFQDVYGFMLIMIEMNELKSSRCYWGRLVY